MAHLCKFMNSHLGHKTIFNPCDIKNNSLCHWRIYGEIGSSLCSLQSAPTVTACAGKTSLSLSHTRGRNLSANVFGDIHLPHARRAIKYSDLSQVVCNNTCARLRRPQHHGGLSTPVTQTLSLWFACGTSRDELCERGFLAAGSVRVSFSRGILSAAHSATFALFRIKVCIQNTFSAVLYRNT